MLRIGKNIVKNNCNKNNSQTTHFIPNFIAEKINTFLLQTAKVRMLSYDSYPYYKNDNTSDKINLFQATVPFYNL